MNEPKTTGPKAGRRQWNRARRRLDGLYSPDEERALARTFGAAFRDYERRVKLPWL